MKASFKFYSLLLKRAELFNVTQTYLGKSSNWRESQSGYTNIKFKVFFNRTNDHDFRNDDVLVSVISRTSLKNSAVLKTFQTLNNARG